jgi:hypothetical protein
MAKIVIEVDDALMPEVVAAMAYVYPRMVIENAEDAARSDEDRVAHLLAERVFNAVKKYREDTAVSTALKTIPVVDKVKIAPKIEVATAVEEEIS